MKDKNTLEYLKIPGLLTLFILILLMSVPAKAKRLSLKQAFEIALQNNPRLAEVRANKKGAKADVLRAVSAFLPKVNIELGYTRSNNPVMVFSDKLNQADFTQADFDVNVLNDPDYRSAWQARLVMLQPIFNQGREFIGYKTARLNEEVSSLLLKSMEQEVLFQVEKSYFQVLLAKDRVNVLESSFKTACSHENLAQKRYDAGLVLKSDLLSAQVQRADIERELYQARADYKIAMAALNSAIGQDQGIEWELDPSRHEFEEAGDLDSWIRKAKKHRPEYLAARDRLTIAEYGYKQSLLRFLPSFNLHGIYQADRENLAYSGGDSWTFMATMSLNLFSGLGDKAGMDKARAQEEQARARLKEVFQQIELEVRQAYYDFKSKKKQLDVAERAVIQARESQKILKKRYENGLALMVELLAADTSLKRAMLQAADARFGARLAWSNLLKKSGVLGTGLLEKNENDKFMASERKHEDQ